MALMMIAAASTCRAAEVSKQVQQMLESTPFRWTGVEIVTNDFDSVERLRHVTGLKPGTVLLLGDPRLKQACDAVRKEKPGASVRCSPVFGPKVDGYVPAQFIVEINVAERAPLVPPRCFSERLAPELAALTNEWMSTMFATMAGGDANGEHVNASRFLDYDSTARHRLAERVHATVAPRISELERASGSCTPESRADAMYLMNFTGEPARAIRSATPRMVDPDSGVRNAATRLLATFDTFITPNVARTIATQACAETISGGFTDRNKSLWLLDLMRQHGLISLSSLGVPCQQEIRGIARTSTAAQTGEPAQALVASASHRAPH
jgi:hypothetical protein